MATAAFEPDAIHFLFYSRLRDNLTSLKLMEDLQGNYQLLCGMSNDWSSDDFHTNKTDATRCRVRAASHSRAEHIMSYIKRHISQLDTNR